MIEARKLSYAYGDGFRLRDLSFTVPQTSVTGIIGPNGSGKSTVLRLLLKILQAPPGSLFLQGRDINDIPQRELAKLVAYVPQSKSADHAFSVRQMVAMGRYAHKSRLFALDETDPKVEEAIDRLDLHAFADRPVTKLSGGEFQRVLTARAIAQDTSVIVLDEPTNHLDLRHQLLLLRLLREESTHNGMTIVAVFHDINLAIHHCDQIVVLNDGELETCADPDSLVAMSTLEDVYGIGFERVKRENGARTLLMGKL